MSDTIIAAMIALAGAGVGCVFTLVADFVKNKSGRFLRKRAKYSKKDGDVERCRIVVYSFGTAFYRAFRWRGTEN